MLRGDILLLSGSGAKQGIRGRSRHGGRRRIGIGGLFRWSGQRTCSNPTVPEWFGGDFTTLDHVASGIARPPQVVPDVLHSIELQSGPACA